MKKLAVFVGLLVLAAVSVFVTGAAKADTVVGVASYHTAAPTTAAGYNAMWDKVNTDEWGAADVSLSVKMGSRSLFVYGDTFSGYHGMVNSTAIVQDGGSLHVSHHGDQLLPQADNDSKGRKVVYWAESAHRVGSDTVAIAVAPTWVSNGGGSNMGWGRTTVKDRVAIVKVAESGDVDFVKWSGWVKAPKLDTRFLGVKDGAPFEKKDHVFYGLRSHPEAKLASGKTLVTVCQNNLVPVKQANGEMNYKSYRPIFMEK